MIAEPQWFFGRPSPTQRQRNSNLQEHFANSGSDRAGDLVREGAQNAGDARRNGQPVRIRIAFGTLPAGRVAVYIKGLVEHAGEVAKQKGMGVIKALSPAAICSYLSFEDFNTTGLTGTPEQERRYEDDPANAFHTFFRAEGQTDKVDERKQGSKGVGKVTFMAPSLPRAVFGLTTRFDDKRTLVFGTAVLHTHRLDGQDFEGDAWFGRLENELVKPIEDAQAVEQFRKDFQLARKPEEPGFSIVVPWLNTDPDDGITPTKIIQAILRDQALPILQGKLMIDVVAPDGTATTIDAAHFLEVLDDQPEALRSQLRPMAELAAWALAHPPAAPTDRLGIHKEGSPSWDDPNIVDPQQRDRLRGELEAGNPVAVRVPIRIRPKAKGQAPLESYFDVFLRREPAASAVAGPTVHFFRADLLISGMGRRLPGTRALIRVEDKGLAGFLRASENPSHTKWASKAVKESYYHAPGTLNYVVESARHLSVLLAGDSAERDASIWAGELSLPTGDEIAGGNGSKKRRKRSVKPDESQEPLPPPPKKRPYDIVAIGGGIAARPSGRPFPGELPVKLELRLAYNVRGKSPLAHYSRADFDLTKVADFPHAATGCTIEEREPNKLVIRIDQPDFEFRTTGFDTRRELFCKPRLEGLAGGGETADETAAATVDDEAAAGTVEVAAKGGAL